MFFKFTILKYKTMFVFIEIQVGGLYFVR